MRIPGILELYPTATEDGRWKGACLRRWDTQRAWTQGLSCLPCARTSVSGATIMGLPWTIQRGRRYRPRFTKACVMAVQLLAMQDAELLVVGSTDSPMFPEELLKFTRRTTFGRAA